MCNRQPGNVLVSPISVKTVLSMVLEGCSGETGKELQAALRLPEQAEARRNYMKNSIIRIKVRLKKKSSDVLKNAFVLGYV